MRKITYLLVLSFFVATTFAQKNLEKVPFGKNPKIFDNSYAKSGDAKSITGILNYDNGKIAFGLGNASAHTIEVYHFFPAEMIEGFVGKKITHFRLGIDDPNAYTKAKLRIYEGTIDGSPEVDETKSTSSLVSGMNIFELSTAYTIPADKELFIGVYFESTGGFGLAVDNDGSTNPINSSLLFFNGTYYGSIAADYGDFIIQALLTDDGVPDGKIKELVVTDLNVKTSGCSLSATESVIVTLRNSGEEKVNEKFNLTVQVNDISVVMQVSPTAFEPDTDIEVEVADFDMASFGKYAVMAKHDFEDHILYNNSLTKSLYSGDGVVTIDLTTDAYASETNWEILDEEGNVYAQNGLLSPETNYRTDVCIDASACFTWKIYDEYGDGIIEGGSFTVYYNGAERGKSLDGDFGYEYTIYGLGDGCPKNEIQLVEFDMPYQMEPQVLKLGGVLLNTGTDPLTTFEITYIINEDTSEVYKLTGVNVPIGYTYGFEHGVAYNFETPGFYNVELIISNPNEQADDETNNSLTDNVIVATEMVSKQQLFEHFTSSTCAPCAGYTPTADALLASNTGNYSLIRYQVDWPGSGDPYYIEQAGDRVQYYGVTGVPSVFRNGGYDMSTDQASFDSYAAQQTIISLDAKAKYYADSVWVTFDVTSAISLPEGLTAHVVIVENETVENVGSNGEKKFHNVMMQMLPTSAGTSLAAITLNENLTYTVGYNMYETFVEEMSDLTAIVFIQDDETKEMLQSIMVPVELGVSINDDPHSTIQIFPNPFNNTLKVSNLGNASNIVVSNVLGQVVMSFPVTESTMHINTQSFHEGVYLITISDKNNNNTTLRIIKQ